MEDLERVMELWLNTNIQAHNFILKEYWISNFDMVKTILPKAEIYVYEIQNKIEAFVGIDSGYIAGIFVSNEMQSIGIGKLLIEKCKQFYDNLSLRKKKKNYRAAKFYAKEGFSIAKEQVDENTGEIEYVMTWKKELSEMSLKELWELFPIILKEHNSQYKEWYKIEERHLFSCIKNEDIKRINHIGSSAVEGLIAKPTVDILLEVDNNCDITRLIETLNINSWILMSSEHEPDLKLVFNKGYTPDGFAEKVYHLHVRYLGDWNELYFRDYLLDHTDIAVQYGNLKLSLWKEYEYNRDGYTEAKSEFIMRYTEKAKLEYTDRYIP